MKTMKIKIVSREKFKSELIELAKSIDAGSSKKPNKKGGIVFESLGAVRKILTENRLEVWRVIRDQKPTSISHLAQLLKREFRSVHRDVMLLSELGLIELFNGPGKRGNVVKLRSLYDELVLSVA
jgi:predicted transcriptional regulator